MMISSILWILALFQSLQQVSSLAPQSDSRFSTIQGTSAATKNLVSSLTAVLNALGNKSQEVKPVRVRKFASLSSAEVLEGIRTDFVDNEYLWSGNISPEIYDEGCSFTDPTLSFNGLSTFEKNLANLKPWIERFVPAENRRVELRSIAIKDGGTAVEAEWRMVGNIELPWRPRLDLEGRTRYVLAGDGGRISSYDEAWAITPSAALRQLITPYEPAYEAKRAGPQPPHWRGRLEGSSPPKPKVVFRGAVPAMVVLPGFGNACADYVEPLNQPEEVGLVASLRRRGVSDCSVVPVQRSDWLKVLRGLLDINFIKGDAQPDGEAFAWYLDLAKSTIENSVESSSGARVVLIGHSAGGWLARALCEREGEDWARQHIRGIVTLGAPHLGPPSTTPDQTRGTVGNLNRRSPGASLRRKKGPGSTFGDRDVFYVTVASDRVVGCAASPSGSAAKIAHDSYAMVCGFGEGIPGDGVVPLNSAHLDDVNARITLNCFHSINEAGTTLPTDDWYGAEGVVDKWLCAVSSELRQQQLKELVNSYQF